MSGKSTEMYLEPDIKNSRLCCENDKKYYLELVALLLLTASVSIGYFIIKGGGFFVVVDDFNEQQITFATSIQEALSQNPKGEWFWGLDLGSSLITGFSFYNLGSIFFWPIFFLPVGTFPYVCGFLYIVKYLVAGLTAFCYLRLFVENRQYAVIGTIIYAFSGFQTVNLEFFHFHDVVALFPLLLLGLELSVKEKRYGPLFVFAVFINCVTNYFFFIQEVIFIVIYFVFRFWHFPKRLFFALMIRCVGQGVLGVGIAAILFVPNVIYILGGARNTARFYLSGLLADTNGVLFILKGMLFPAETMNNWSALQHANWRSTSCYLPLFGLSFVLSFIRHGKGWLKRLLLFLLLISFSPLLQSGFLLFTAAYQRWWYMLVLLMALATIVALERLEKRQLQEGVIFYFGISTALLLALFFIKWSDLEESVVFMPRKLLIFYAFVLISSFCLFMLLSAKKHKTEKIIIAVVLLSIATTSYTLHLYRTGTVLSEVKQDYYSGLYLPKENEQYRYNSVINYQTLEVQDSLTLSLMSRQVTEALNAKMYTAFRSFSQGNIQ